MPMNFRVLLPPRANGVRLAASAATGTLRNFRPRNPVCEKIDLRLTIDGIEDFRLPLPYTEFVRFSRLAVLLFSPFLCGISEGPALAPPAPSKIKFSLATLPFRVESDETLKNPHAPATMAGGVAVFDYNKDGRPDIFFTNGANIETLKKDSAKFSNRLYRNDGNGVFTDVTKEAGLGGTGFDIAVAVADYDNDGWPDLFVGGVHGSTLYHNNGNGTFTDVTAKAGLDHSTDPEFGPWWSVAAAWVDVNNDGLLDLFVVNYMQWKYDSKPLCSYQGQADFCHPRF